MKSPDSNSRPVLPSAEKDNRTELKITQEELLRTKTELVITQTKIEMLEKERGIDVLTGLFNRRALEEKLPRLFEELNSEGEGRPFSIMAIDLDIDHFKILNDAYGHHKGDEALIVLAERLREAVKEWGGDLAFRSTSSRGDEFVLVLPIRSQVDDDKLEEVFQRIKTKINTDLHINTEKGNVLFTVSMVYAVAKAGDSKTSKQLRREIDIEQIKNKKNR